MVFKRMLSKKVHLKIKLEETTKKNVKCTRHCMQDYNRTVQNLPKTFKKAWPLTCPASLVLMHVYNPASDFLTEDINKSPLSRT